ncbi:MAG: nicotinate-nucleotide adenylyltransferase, partial [Victivallales bacterium]|nr:nicotinate-nucleotide adenylyltransferase [Victivallales bacterium]
GGDRPYRRPYNRDENNTEGGDRPYRRPYNRDENGAGGDRPYRRPYNRDENGAGGDRPYRRPYNRDENGAGGDRPYRRPFNRDENNTEGGDRPYRRPYNRDENGNGGDRPYRRPFNRDENGIGGDRPYRRPYNRDENGTEGGDRPYRRPFNRDENGDRPPRSPRRFGDPRENGPVDEMSERSVIDSNRKDDIAISGDRPYRPYKPYLMEDENGVMHASYRPFKKSYEVDADGIAHPPRKPEGQEGEETRPPRDFADRNDAKDTDKATWSFSTQDDKTDGDDKPLTEQHDGDDMHLEEALSAAETQTETPSGASTEAAEQTSETAEQSVLPENGTESQESENKDDASKDAWPRHDRFSRRDGDGFDRPRRRFDRGDNGFDRPPRRFDREGNGDGFNRPPRRRFGDDNGEGGEQPQNGVNEAGMAVKPEEAEQPLPYARKQRIAVFGGSFDPIHNGHLLIAQKVLELDKADEILFVPALLPPHKMNRLVATPEQRLEMIKLALADQEKCSFTDVELQRAGAPSYTFDTMSILKQIYSDCELFLLIGMDSLVGLHSWYRATELVTRGKFIIYPRPGVERPPIYELEKEFGSKNAYKLTYSIMDNEELAQSDISSTTVRDAIAQHLSPEKYVPQAVAQYIHDNNIYS